MIFSRKKVTYEEKKHTVLTHLVNMNKQIFQKQNIPFNDYWTGALYATALKDTDDLIIAGQLNSYYERLIKGAI